MPKLTPKSRTRARFLLTLRWSFLLSSWACLAGGLAAAFYDFARQLFPRLGMIPAFEVENPLDWAVFWLALAIITGGILPLWEGIVNDEAQDLRRIRDAGRVPRFSPVARREDEIAVPPERGLTTSTEIARSRSAAYNQLLYKQYHDHSVAEGRVGFEILGLPVYFVIPPGPSFEVKLQFGGNPLDHEELAQMAADQGFDWYGLKNARVTDREQESDTRYWEDALRAVGLNFDLQVGRRQATLTCCKGSYRDYVATELSVDLVYDGLPNLREFFEGEAWQQKTMDLRLIDVASARYEMRVGVAALVATRDGYLVFQRRSEVVETATGGLAASGTGGVRWTDVRQGWRRSRRGLLGGLFSLKRVGNTLTTGLFREVSEELGVCEADFVPDERPFMAAALNLKYGRDLNFYAFLRSGLTCCDFSVARDHATDRWEVAHLVFVPPTSINERGELSPPFEKLLGDSRHLRGLLYSAYRDDRFKSVRDKFAASRQGRVVTTKASSQ